MSPSDGPDAQARPLAKLKWVDDYVELADHLRLAPCSIVGWSGGGPSVIAPTISVRRRLYRPKVVLGLAASAIRTTRTIGLLISFAGAA